HHTIDLADDPSFTRLAGFEQLGSDHWLMGVSKTQNKHWTRTISVFSSLLLRSHDHTGDGVGVRQHAWDERGVDVRWIRPAPAPSDQCHLRRVAETIHYQLARFESEYKGRDCSRPLYGLERCITRQQ